MLRTNFPTKYLKTLLRLMHSYGILIIAENYELYHGNQLQSLTFFFLSSRHTNSEYIWVVSHFCLDLIFSEPI